MEPKAKPHFKKITIIVLITVIFLVILTIALASISVLKGQGGHEPTPEFTQTALANGLDGALEEQGELLNSQEAKEDPDDNQTDENSPDAGEENDDKKLENKIKPEKPVDAQEKPKIAEGFVMPAYTTPQGAVDVWLKNYRHGDVGIEIVNVNNGAVVASYRPYNQMLPKSLYKLFYLYDAYAQIDAGRDDPNQSYAEGKTLAACLDVIVRVSDNPCAEAMYNDPARSQRVAQLIGRLGLSSTRPDALMTSAHDVVRLLQHYYAHPDWSQASWLKFRETALNQPYNLRKGLPSGFRTATVYSKAGWGGNVYNDAALVEFPDGRRHIIVVMTTNTDYSLLKTLGSMLETVL